MPFWDYKNQHATCAGLMEPLNQDMRKPCDWQSRCTNSHRRGIKARVLTLDQRHMLPIPSGREIISQEVANGPMEIEMIESVREHQMWMEEAGLPLTSNVKAGVRSA